MNERADADRIFGAWLEQLALAKQARDFGADLFAKRAFANSIQRRGVALHAVGAGRGKRTHGLSALERSSLPPLGTSSAPATAAGVRRRSVGRGNRIDGNRSRRPLAF